MAPFISANSVIAHRDAGQLHPAAKPLKIPMIKRYQHRFRPDCLAYMVVGVLAGAATLSRVNVNNPLDVFVFLACAMFVSIGPPVAAGERALPAGLFVLLVGIDKLSRPELLFVGLVITLL